jgi:hypothetical protein
VDKVFGRKQQCNIDDRLPRGCVLLSDVALRLGSCNPSAVFGVWVVTRRRLLQVAGTRVVVWLLVLALWFGERRADGMGAVSLGPVRPGARAGILSQVRALFFCGGGGEGGRDETSCCECSRCCMLGFALGVLSGASRAVNQIITV